MPIIGCLLYQYVLCHYEVEWYYFSGEEMSVLGNVHTLTYTLRLVQIQWVFNSKRGLHPKYSLRFDSAGFSFFDTLWLQYLGAPGIFPLSFTNWESQLVTNHITWPIE